MARPNKRPASGRNYLARTVETDFLRRQWTFPWLPEGTPVGERKPTHCKSPQDRTQGPWARSLSEAMAKRGAAA